jgi:hypothetical protein
VDVSIDGVKLASADGWPSAGAGARAFSVDQVSVSALERIEVNDPTGAK